MKDYLKKYGFGFLLYGLLGFVLYFAGITVVEKPVEFCLILTIVITIDVISFKQGLRA